MGLDVQAQRLGPKFERLSHTVSSPEVLAELRSDPGAIVPERALVFEVAGDLVDVERAMRGIQLEILDEQDSERPPSADVFLKEEVNRPADERRRRVPVRLYFTMPDAKALQQLLSVWSIWQRGEDLPQGKKSWAGLFAHLSDLRPWGPADRVTEEVMEDWEYRLQHEPTKPVRFEVEFWFRKAASERDRAETSFLDLLKTVGGKVVRQKAIEAIAYHAALVDVPAVHVSELMAHPEVSIGGHDDVMFIVPQARVGEPFEVDPEEKAGPPRDVTPLRPAFAALFDGVPMAGHSQLEGLLDVDDPDEYAERYGSALEQRHATAMAALITGGNLDSPTRIKSRLYVRPVMYPRDGEEQVPDDELVVDLIWRSIIRMKEGEGDGAAAAPDVRVVNLSLGNAHQRFARMMSPWARLIDYVAWKYRLLIIISAGNIYHPIILSETTWTALEAAMPADRERLILSGVLKEVSNRQLLSPAESINALTIGARHEDSCGARRGGSMMVEAYQNRWLPNPSSALGPGFNGSVKPELLFPGGREQVRFSSSAPLQVKPVGQSPHFGLKTAGPGPGNRLVYVNGTSCAAALATNAVLRIVDGLEEAAADDGQLSIEPEFYDVILKALVVHGAQWDPETVAALKSLLNPEGKKLHWQHTRDALCRVLGYGQPDIERVLDCTEGRATLLGWGAIRDGEADRFLIPLPDGLQGIVGFRAVTITVGWVTPVNPGHRAYRMSKLDVVAGGDRKFSLGVVGAQCQPAPSTTARGTVLHRRWEGEDAVSFVDGGNLVVDVTCKTADGLDVGAIPYSIATTIEVGQGVIVPVYEQVRSRLRVSQRVPVR